MTSVRSLRRSSIIPIADWTSQYLPIIIEDLLNERTEVNQLLHAYIGAQAMRCVLEAKALSMPFRSEVMSTFDEERLYFALCEYAEENLQRFRGPSDRLERILDLKSTKKMAQKYREHISGLKKFVSLYASSVEDFPARRRPWRPDIDRAIYVFEEAEHNIWGTLLEADGR